MAICPECEAVVEDLDYAEKGEVITCPECGVDLEIVDTDPVELELVSELADDDDDEEEEDEDELDDEDEEEEEDDEEDDDLGKDDGSEDNRRWK
jgi:alpha-aminoadipate carrier protein LysW